MAQPKPPHGFLASIAIAAQPLRMSPTTLQVAAGALLHRRGAGLGDVAKIEAVAVGAADADGKGAGRFGGADQGDREANGGNGERGIAPETIRDRHGSPSPEEPWNASGEEFPDGEQG